MENKLKEIACRLDIFRHTGERIWTEICPNFNTALSRYHKINVVNQLGALEAENFQFNDRLELFYTRDIKVTVYITPLQ